MIGFKVERGDEFAVGFYEEVIGSNMFDAQFLGQRMRPIVGADDQPRPSEFHGPFSLASRVPRM